MADLDVHLRVRPVGHEVVGVRTDRRLLLFFHRVFLATGLSLDDSCHEKPETVCGAEYQESGDEEKEIRDECVARCVLVGGSGYPGLTRWVVLLGFLLACHGVRKNGATL